ncbi:unnamed protein product [Fraxinus pennsylvanica]|uniref:Uncharacterized protein n=1 Tax=Fraxinus pennsylvanica TaxID=56036 RepID=A0AAD2AAC9_9LAMI|nr:unnamed protein product [Fraxinus pennsylvanica]
MEEICILEMPDNVYERLIQKGKKPGFFQLLATQTVSAAWHGLYPGYIIFFVKSAVMIAGSRVFYGWQQATQSVLFKKIFVFLNFAYTLLVLNYSCVGFIRTGIKPARNLSCIWECMLCWNRYFNSIDPARKKSLSQQGPPDLKLGKISKVEIASLISVFESVDIRKILGS